MNREQELVLNFMDRIPNQAGSIADKPSIPSLEVRILRARLMLEECLETIEKGLGVIVVSRYADTKELYPNLEFYASGMQNLPEIADGLADQLVVIYGTAVACGIDMEPIYNEVMDNNMSKLQKGTIDEFGKLIKPINHPKPDIEGELKKQGWEE